MSKLHWKHIKQNSLVLQTLHVRSINYQKICINGCNQDLHGLSLRDYHFVDSLNIAQYDFTSVQSLIVLSLTLAISLREIYDKSVMQPRITMPPGYKRPSLYFLILLFLSATKELFHCNCFLKTILMFILAFTANISIFKNLIILSKI